MDTLERLRADCMGLKRSQLEKLADVMGIARSTFRRIVAGTGHNYHYSNIRKIEDYYAAAPVARLALEEQQQATRRGSGRQMMG